MIALIRSATKIKVRARETLTLVSVCWLSRSCLRPFIKSLSCFLALALSTRRSLLCAFVTSEWQATQSVLMFSRLHSPTQDYNQSLYIPTEDYMKIYIKKKIIKNKLRLHCISPPPLYTGTMWSACHALPSLGSLISFSSLHIMYYVLSSYSGLKKIRILFVSQIYI